MLRTRFQWAILLFFLVPSVFAAEESRLPKKYALLVGCTQYEYENIRSLKGPINDVRLWKTTLTDPAGLAFSAENIVELTSGPGAVKPPTCRNIVRAFEDLVKKVGPGDQVVILLSGHGMQMPIPKDQDPLDPRNPEPDGLDEIFLAADARPWNAETESLVNVIKDDQFGQWLNQMRNKGAHVWILFDCCHAGTMMRGQGEVARTVYPAAMGIPATAIADAVKRAQSAVAAAEKKNRKPLEEFAVKVARSAPGQQGRVVAFYAAQPFETAPERPYPEGAPLRPEYYHGVLSHTVVSCLESLRGRANEVSYHELMQLVLARYRAERGTTDPTPGLEGDADGAVLGLKRWPGRSQLLLQKSEDSVELTVTAGSLHGLTPGTVLALHPPVGDARPAELVLGHVVVEAATAVAATVGPVAVDNKPALAVADIPDLARCSIVSQDLGDLRLRLHVGTNARLVRAVGLLSPEVKRLVEIVTEEERAQWLLREVTAAEAKQRFGAVGRDPGIVLIPRQEGIKEPPDSVESARRKQAQVERKKQARVQYGFYGLQEADKLARLLDIDLPKVFRARNLLRLATEAGASSGGSGLRLILKVHKDTRDTEGTAFTSDTLRVGQVVSYEIVAEGAENLWITALYVNSRLGIEQELKASIKDGGKLFSQSWVIEARPDELGAESLIILAVPITKLHQEPDYSFLVQPPLGAVGRGPGEVRKALDTRKLSPFEQFLAESAVGSPQMRSVRKAAPVKPIVLLRSWVIEQ